jgi:exodeoxyribonuclease V alpha subunit
VAHFGADTLEVIESHPSRLLEVPDIGLKRARLIARAWEEQKQVKEIMLFLHSRGVSTNLAVKIYKQYGDQALNVVQSDPYRLARDIFGVGFKTADRLAQDLGLPPDHPSRIEAGVVFVLNDMTDEGHVYTPQQTLIDRACELLGVSPDLLPSALERLANDERIRPDRVPFSVETPSTSHNIGSPSTISDASGEYRQAVIYLTPLYYSETSVSERLHGLAYALPSRLSDLPPAFVDLDEHLSPEQQTAIRTALSHPVSVLTGGPGTGKTTALKALIAVLESARKKYALASPTGRAAKRLSEATGQPASTIHRLLGFSPKEGFKHNAENPLPVDLLVIDEASMLDLSLTNHL